MPHILIVDDEPNNLYMLSVLLKSHGYRITEAVSGSEALTAALKDTPDLIISDILMPGMDGYELCRQWMSVLKLRSVPFMFYSATYTDPADIEFALKLGASKFLIKPSEPDELLNAINTLFNSNPSVQIPAANELEIARLHKERVSAKLGKKIKDLAQETQQRCLLEHERDILISGIEQASDAIIITDANGIITYTNPAFERISLYNRDEIKGQNPRILQSGIQDAQFYREMWSILLSGKPWRGQVINKRKNNSLYTEDITISPVFDSAGNITNYIAFMSDVTEKLKLEQELRRAQKLESVGMLAGGIAHDFNNLLFAVLGNAELAIDLIPEDHPAYEMIHDVISAGHRAEELVKQILLFSRKATINPNPLRIVPVIKEALKMTRSTQPANIKLEFICEITPDQACVLADPTSIHQVIMNLCTNACQAMWKTGGTLSVELARINPDSDKQQRGLADTSCLEIRVKDTGSGIEANVLEHIFEPFFTTKEVGKGTGMGLAVVHGIIQDLQGQITVESEIGRGTDFKILLPLFENPVPEQVVESNVTPKGSGHVLVIDDDVMVTRVITSMLKDLGYTVTAHCSSVDGLKAFLDSPNRFDVVIADQNMPLMSGVEVTSQILAQYPNQKTVLITGFSNTLNEEKAERIGVSSFIRKPITKKELAIALHQTLCSP